MRTPSQGRGRQPGLRWTAGIAVLVLLLAPLLGAQGGAPERNGAPIPAGSFADYQGRRVNAIEILTGARIDRPRLLSLMPQKVGQSLERDKVRRSIRLLYSSGRFSDIEVEAQKQGADEVTLVFHARESFFIGQVSVQGAPKRPSAVQLVNAAKLPLGEAFGEERLKDALGRMNALLADEGYYKAAITPSFTFRNDEQQVDIAFTVERGPLATLGKLEVRGNPALSVAEIERIAKLFPEITSAASGCATACSACGAITRRTAGWRPRSDCCSATTTRSTTPSITSCGWSAARWWKCWSRASTCAAAW